MDVDIAVVSIDEYLPVSMFTLFGIKLKFLQSDQEEQQDKHRNIVDGDVNQLSGLCRVDVVPIENQRTGQALETVNPESSDDDGVIQPVRLGG